MSLLDHPTVWWKAVGPTLNPLLMTIPGACWLVAAVAVVKFSLASPRCEAANVTIGTSLLVAGNEQCLIEDQKIMQHAREVLHGGG
jgi:hypothetical protein